MTMRTLPDLLSSGLNLVFVGINPGEQSARAGHYYAHPGNGFWPALSASPLVDRTLTSEDDRALPLAERIGFTDVVKRVVTDSTEVTTEEIRASAPAFRGRIAYASPRAVCFTSTRAFDLLFPRIRAANGWGRQPVAIEGAQVWVMPSTSGRAIRHREHVHRVLRELASELADPATDPQSDRIAVA
jgi:double-stranded uracil-DNA glycosylase